MKKSFHDIGKETQTTEKAKRHYPGTLADYLNVSYQAVSKWENEASSPDIGLLPKLSAYYGVTIDDLFTLSGDAHLKRIENMLDHQEAILALLKEDWSITFGQLVDGIKGEIERLDHLSTSSGSRQEQYILEK